MKNLFFFIAFVFLLLSVQVNGQTGSFKVRNDALIQIGYNGLSKALVFGGNESFSWTHQNGLLGMEFWNDGLNFFTPWPSYGAGNYKLFITRAGETKGSFVGIGKNPSHKLDVNGDIATFGTVQITSDRRLKKNIIPLQGINSLAAITSLKTYTYQYIYDELPITYDDQLIEDADSIKLQTIQADLERKPNLNTKIRTGFMAQEVMEILPNLVEKDADERYTIDYMALIPLMTSAIQEQQTLIKQLLEKTKSLENEIDNLKRK